VSTRSGLLYVVLLLIVAAFGLLVAALISTQTLWAWGSVLLSISAAAVLFLERQRRRRGVADPRAPAQAAALPLAVPLTEESDGSDADPQGDAGGPRGQQGTGDLEDPPTGGTQAITSSSSEEPGEEDTDASDALVVSELDDEVRVVDERPRYHLASCEWLGDRATLALPVSEAHQLGFTPCARCAPDSTLAAAHRTGHTT
jgi:hypothetical protein